MVEERFLFPFLVVILKDYFLLSVIKARILTHYWAIFPTRGV